MNTIIKLGLMVFALGAFSGLPSLAGTPNQSPSKNSNHKTGQQRPTIAVSKSGVGVGQANQTASKTGNGSVITTSYRHTRSPR